MRLITVARRRKNNAIFCGAFQKNRARFELSISTYENTQTADVNFGPVCRSRERLGFAFKDVEIVQSAKYEI